MTAPRRYNFAPPLRGLVQRQNPSTVPVDASAEQRDMSYAEGQFSTRHGFYVRRRMAEVNGLPARYGALVRLTDGALFPWFAHAGSVYRDTGVDLAPQLISADMAGWRTDRCPAMVQIGHALLVNGEVTGGKVPRVWDGSTDYAAGIDPPLTAPSVSTTTVDAVTSTVRQDFTKDIVVVVTFGSDTWVAESEPGPATRLTPQTAKVKLVLTSLPVSSNPRVGYRNIWVSIDGGLTFFLGAKISDNTTTALNLQQWSSVETELKKYGGLYSECSVPQGDIMELHEGRLFVASGTTLYWSEKGTPEVFHPLAQLAFQDPRGITALKSHGGRLVVAGRSNLWSLSGSFDMDDAGGSDYTGKHLSSGIGVVGRDAITTYGTIAYLLSDQGFYSQQGDEAPVPRSDGLVEPLIRKITPGWALEAQLTYSVATGEVLCAVPVKDAQNPNQNQRVLVYRPKEEAWGWWHGRFSSLSLAYDDGDTLDLFACDYSGNVLRLCYGHGDGLQGDEAYGPSGAQVDEGVQVTAVSGGMILTLDTASLPSDGTLRGAMLTLVDMDEESEDYGTVETHKVLGNSQSGATVTIEDPTLLSTTTSRRVMAYLGGVASLAETSRSDFGTPGARKILTQVEVAMNDPRRELDT